MRPKNLLPFSAFLFLSLSTAFCLERPELLGVRLQNWFASPAPHLRGFLFQEKKQEENLADKIRDIESGVKDAEMTTSYAIQFTRWAYDYLVQYVRSGCKDTNALQQAINMALQGADRAAQAKQKAADKLSAIRSLGTSEGDEESAQAAKDLAEAAKSLNSQAQQATDFSDELSRSVMSAVEDRQMIASADSLRREASDLKEESARVVSASRDLSEKLSKDKKDQ